MNEDVIYQIHEYVGKLRYNDTFETDRPIQRPFSSWAINEIIDELRENQNSFADEVISNFISLMQKYEDASEPERKLLYKTAIDTAKELYFYLFERRIN